MWVGEGRVGGVGCWFEVGKEWEVGKRKRCSSESEKRSRGGRVQKRKERPQNARARGWVLTLSHAVDVAVAIIDVGGGVAVAGAIVHKVPADGVAVGVGLAHFESCSLTLTELGFVGKVR